MHKCKPCGKEFAGLEALNSHKKDKHHIKEEEKESTYRKMYFYLFAIFIIVFIVFLAYSFVSGEDECSKPAKETNIGGHKNLELHIHPHLKIIIDEKQETVPKDIGIAYGIMRPIHTHDDSGKIHIEDHCKRNFTLKDFFSIYEKDFNSQCIFDKCIDDNTSNNKGSLKMFVDGKESQEFENLVLKDKQEIVIEYKSSTE
ncbi:MAG: hypothetical protein AABW90_01125 [Nanoarchaeota archaeon]